MNYTKAKTAAFTGHRTFKIAGSQQTLFCTIPSEDEIRKRLLQSITKLYDAGYDTFMCGMAEGFDLMAGEAVIALAQQYPDIKLIAAIPFPEQSHRMKPADRERYRHICDHAYDIVTICPVYQDDCFLRRDDYMVDNSSALICLYAGIKGGTAYTVKRAIRAGLRVVNLI
jgi:uncharacterized phage-like protein YoqJ